MTDKYVVIGNPIAHSKSPQIHAAFAKQTNQDISYEAILAPLDGFKPALQALLDAGYRGINITVPFKFEAYDACQQHTERAFVAGAVNTISFHGGQIAGDNTDGVGLVNDIKNNLEHALKGARILLLGAGGAAQGVLLPLLNVNPASIVIANRTLAKAQQMAEKSGVTAIVSANTFESLQGNFDVIINATSTGLTDIALPIPNSIFAKNCLAYDMMYGRETPFMAQARANGAQVADGLGMLVEQAAEAFYLWRGVQPQSAPVIKMLRQQ
jgi:shikimate dehydrogenase